MQEARSISIDVDGTLSLSEGARRYAGTVCLLLKISTVPLLLKVILILDKQNKDKQGSYPRALM